MKTKLETLKDAFYAGDYRKALSIAAKFPQLGKEKSDIITAHECFTNPAFYAQLGYSINDCIDAGINALKTKYSLAV